MPNYKGHLVGGMAAYGLLLCTLLALVKPSLLTASEWLLFALAGSLFPDIDIKSKGQKYFYYFILLVFIVLVVGKRFEAMACCGFIVIWPMLVNHRGIFHNPWFVVIMPLVLWIIISSIIPGVSQQFFFDILFFIVGAVSHIWLDFGTGQMLKKLFMRKKTRW